MALTALHVVAITVGVTFAAPLSEQSHIRVALENLDASLGGNTPGVAWWDDLGEVVRQAFESGQKIPQGSFAGIKINASNTVGNVPPTYMSVTNGGDDAVCIQSISLTSPNGERGGFAGGVLKQCGADWLYSS